MVLTPESLEHLPVNACDRDPRENEEGYCTAVHTIVTFFSSNLGEFGFLITALRVRTQVDTLLQFLFTHDNPARTIKAVFFLAPNSESRTIVSPTR